MTSGSAPRKILDLRPYLAPRPEAGDAPVHRPEEDTQELLDDSPEDTAGAGAGPGRPAWLVPAGPALFAAVVGSGLFAIAAPAAAVAAAPVFAGVALAAAWLTDRSHRKGRADAPGIDGGDARRRHERNGLVQTITALATTLEARDPYTKDHSRQVARLSVRLGQRLGLGREHLYELHLAGLLHDIGKIGVPDHILLKPSRLTDDEMKIVRSHVEWSHDILSSVRGLRAIAVIARHHHERYDGEGYPDRLAGETIPAGARVMAVADMFMAMTEDRPYRKGLPVTAAIAELKRVSGRQLDPVFVREFLAILAEEGYPEAGDSDAKSAAAN